MREGQRGRKNSLRRTWNKGVPMEKVILLLGLGFFSFTTTLLGGIALN